LRSARVTNNHGYVSIFLFLCNHNPVLPSFITYHRVCNKSNTTGATCGAETAYPFGTPKFIPVFGVVCVVRTSVFFVMFCRLLYGLFLLVILLSVFRFTNVDYPLRTFKHFFGHFGFQLVTAIMQEVPNMKTKLFPIDLI